ncbi:related to integral membrane protein PTH11 [Phialocephala subalpina]|uniref:Related to integral membrane protein PTH11 n=1 Tax=Phialocephala subalpina TaxID=576137 RepID=A0A1L7XJ38_9HELO|nr:related to integral membrane protein PTH11 [Phialocephala subalpina]
MSVPKPNGPDIDIGPQMLATGWTLYGLAGVVVGMRIFTQVKISRQFGLGDIVMLLALMFGFLHILFITISHHFGWGRHFFYLDDYKKVTSMEMEFISEPFGILCSALGRVSFIILMFRLFGTTKYRRWFLHFMIAQSLVVNLVTCITIFVQCGDVRSLWDPVGVPSKCWVPAAQADIGFFQGACNSMTDLILTVLPSSIFWTLQMKLRIKLGLVALLGLSIFAFVASIIKTVKLQSLGERSDYTFNTVSFMNWVVIENTFVMIGSSIPLMRPLFKKAKDSAMSHYGQSSSYELGSRAQSSKAKAYARSQTKSIPLASSSEENILPIHNTGKRASTAIKGGEEGGTTAKYNIEGIQKEVKVEIRYERDDESESEAKTPANSPWASRRFGA